MPRYLERIVAQFIPTNNTLGVRQRLPLGLTVAQYTIRNVGNFTVGTNAVTLNDEAPFGYIRNLQLVLGGSFPLRQQDFRSVRRLNQFMQGTDDQFLAPAVTAAAVTNGIFSEATVDIEMNDLVPPLDRAFWLDSRRLSNLELVFDFGTQDDITAANGGATPNSYVPTQLTITAKEVQDVGGPTSRMQISKQQMANLVVGDNDLQLTALGPAYKWIHLRAVSGNVDPNRGTSDDTIINTVSVLADNIRILDQKTYAALRQENKKVFSLEVMPPGNAVLNFAKSKNLNDLLQTGNRRTLILRVNVASVPANAFILVYLVNAIVLTDTRGGIVLPARAARPTVAATRR